MPKSRAQAVNRHQEAGEPEQQHDASAEPVPDQATAASQRQNGRDAARDQTRSRGER